MELGRLVGAGLQEAYETLKQHCEEIGRPFDEITLTAGAWISFPEDLSTFEPTYEHSFYPGQTFDVFGPTPAEAIVELRKLVDVGVSHFPLIFDDPRVLRRFVDEVVPAFRA